MKTWKDLDVWKKAHELVLRIYRSVDSFPSQEQYRLVDQLCCSARMMIEVIKIAECYNTNKAFTRGEVYE